MGDNEISKFSAVDATLGYLYQIRLALLWSLKRLKEETEFLVSIETLDDVTFETTLGNAAELLQTKHHFTSKAALTDASVDLWKTLRIWFEGYASGSIPQVVDLYLITTSDAPVGSAAFYLRTEQRNVLYAMSALDSTAASSTNKSNEDAYKAYVSLDQSERIGILERVIVLDSSPNIIDIGNALRQEVFWAAGKENHEAFLERLEGWWLRSVLRQLTKVPKERIASVQIEGQLTDLREQFKRESLPIDDDLIEFTLDEATNSVHQNSPFVHQLNLIKAGKRRIAAAIRDYYRAFEQRSRWLRNDLIMGMDLDKYERKLVEEWDFVFNAMRDELGDESTDDEMEVAARSVLQWAERVLIPIRPNVIEPFLSRGSLHMLSDEVRIGWHPKFRNLLSTALGLEEQEQ
jgi:hypothetical protein